MLSSHRPQNKDFERNSIKNSIKFHDHYRTYSIYYVLYNSVQVKMGLVAAIVVFDHELHLRFVAATI